jgi:hypothetical protein
MRGKEQQRKMKKKEQQNDRRGNLLLLPVVRYGELALGRKAENLW